MLASLALDQAFHLVFVVALILGVGIGAQCIAAVTRLPALPLLLACGIVLGPLTGVLRPQEDFGDGLRPLIQLAVAIVLFEGGLSLRLQEARVVGRALWQLILSGLFVGAAVVAWLGTALIGLSFGTAAVLGAILVVTGPTVVLPMLRGSRLSSRPAALLKWEGIVNDPLGALLALFVLQAVLVDSDAGVAQLAVDLLVAAGAAVVIGGAAAIVLEWVLRHPRLPDHLHSPLILAGVIAVFTAAETLGTETGLLAVTVAGLVLANLPRARIDDIRHFKEQVTAILVAGLFVVLAANLELSSLRPLLGAPLLLILAVALVARPLVAFVGTMRTDLPWRERVIIAWIAPRGIVAAAVAGAFEPRLQQAGFEDADMLVPIVFGVIALTVVAQGFSIRPLSRALGLGSSDGSGLLIVGVRSFTIAIAQALERAGATVHLTDTLYGRVSRARRAGLQAHYQDILAEDAAITVPMERLSWVLAATEDDGYNTVVCMNLARQFGPHTTLQLTPESASDRGAMKGSLPSRTPWGPAGTYRALTRAYWRSEDVRVTQLTDTFGLDDLRRQDPDARVLFAVDEDRIEPIEHDGSARSGVAVVYLPGPQAQTQKPRPPGDEAPRELP